MKPKNLLLRCFAMQEADGSWFAICLDLNLYSRGDTFPEVQGKLNVFIKEYVTEAFTEDEAYFSDLIRRPAPLYFWLRYRWACLLSTFHITVDRLKFFFLHLPLIPAA